MELSQKELDIINFNKDFEEKDKLRKQYQERKYIIKDELHQEKNTIDKLILKMRLAFDFIIKKFEKLENPTEDILNNEELIQGTIYLLFFFGTVTLLLSGLMKK